MDRGYEAYCLANRWFYDSPTAAPGPEQDFVLGRQVPPPGWQRVELDDWLMYAPHETRLPAQGWKIHVSATLDNAEDTLEIVWRHLVPRGVPFKFLRGLEHLFIRNSKYADRGGSGKFITIYPADEEQLERLLVELDAQLSGREGPYVLSDLRWAEGPLYVRYGGFAELYCVGPSGEVEAAILDAEGTLVPDRRGPTFQVPAWIELPGFLRPHLEARNRTKVVDMPYRITEALHFSNAGGLYAGTDVRTGERVVLKEARPHAGLSVDRADAVARLGREAEMLERVADLGVAPAVRDRFEMGGHHFLVLEHVPGQPLSAEVAKRYPLVMPTTDAAAAYEYTDWAVTACHRLEEAVHRIHARGVVITDLHPSNVMVRPDDTVSLIDWEVAADAAEDRRQALADPAFMAPEGLRGRDIDDYALACIRLFVFMPLTMLFGLSREKAHDLAEDIRELFPTPAGFLEEAVARIVPDPGATGGGRRRFRPEPTPAGWREARAAMTQAILASATPERRDRLFPGDVKQFGRPGGGLGLAFGAAGVLYALHACGAGRSPEHEDWLVRRALHPEPGARLGLYDGLHGVAYALDALGRRDDALAVLEICTAELEGKYEHLPSELVGGLAGMALNLAHFASVTGDAGLWDLTWQLAQILTDRLGDVDDVAEVSGGDHPYAGLTRGGAGVALALVRLYEHSGYDALLDSAAIALEQDLRRCLKREEDGALEVNEGFRTMPYLADGSVGIGTVLDDYLVHRCDERFAQAAADIHRAAEAQFYIEPGLFWGRAGMILYLARHGRNEAIDPVVAGHVRRLKWHAVRHPAGPAFPGEQLLRLSMDLATGTAGVMLALGAALHDQSVFLPFLGPLPTRATEPVRVHASAERR